MSPEQEARERAQLLKVLDILIGWASMELPEIHCDSVQKWAGNKKESVLAKDQA